MSQFSLKVESLIVPPLPEYHHIPASGVEWSLLRQVATPTSPLKFIVSLGPRGFYPASHLQLCWVFEGTGSIFTPVFITEKDLVKIGEQYEVTVLPENIPRIKVNEGESSTGKIIAYAWKGEKLLGQWEIGKIEGLGLEGYKSFDLAKRRVEQWKKTEASS